MFLQRSSRCLLKANTILISSKGEAIGRKKKEFGAKEKRIYFRVSEALHEAIVRSAKKNGLSVSEYCRLALINQPIQKLPVIIHDERKILQELQDWAAGRITESNFNMLSQRYQKEQEEQEQKIQDCKTKLAAGQQTVEDAQKWVELIKQIGVPKELTAELLNTLIEKIIVHEATEDDFGFRQQEIEIIFRFVGKID